MKSPTPILSQLPTREALSGADGAALLETARRLRRAAQAGHVGAPLRGKNIALVCDLPHESAPMALSRAAAALGAQVALLRPGHGDVTDLDGTARMLGRLYDAIDCEGVPEDLLQRIELHAGVPVFNGLGEASHPLRALASSLESVEGTDAADHVHLLLQAALLRALV